MFTSAPVWCGAYRTLRANITSLNFTSITVFDSIDRLDEYEYEYEYDGHECELSSSTRMAVSTDQNMYSTEQYMYCT